jgi:serine protease AprX
VVASAGNGGPNPMSIGVPGNIPYIITVGAMTDNYTPNDRSDDKLASFSAAGPTIEGFVKPEIVAPGGHISGLMALDTAIVNEHPEYHDGGRYFEMSGTSQAAAVVSGAVALMLSKNPALTPEQIKCLLVASARPAVNDKDELAYSIFQQGAGVVNVADALTSQEQCPIQSMDITKDLANEQHYFGPAYLNEHGDFAIKDSEKNYNWNTNNEVISGDGFIWRTNFDIDGFIWRTSFDTDTDLLWRSDFETDGFIWRTNVETDGFIWRTSVDIDNSSTISINNWVEQQ